MKFTHKSLIRAFSAVLLLLLTLNVKMAKASHFAAADITVEYAGTGPGDLTYRVIVDLYYSCNASTNPAGGAGTVYFFSAQAGHAPYVNDNTRSISMTWDGVADDIDQLCAGAKNLSKCQNTSNPYPGFKHTRSVGTKTLPSAQTDWTFYWSSCCRDGGIVNISQPGSGTGCNPQGNIFVDATINNKFRYDQGTPKFTVQPLPYLCVGIPSTYLNGPLDPFGDSLVTENVIPRDQWNSFYNYCTPYTAIDPIGAATSAPLNPYNTDPTTGTATFTAMFPGQHVVAFKVTSYDRATGTKLGVCNRDVQVSILNCNGTAPNLSDPQNITFGELSNDKDKFTTCSGVKFDFDVKASTTLPNRALYMEANLTNFPGASFTVVGEGTTNVTGTFSWAPHYGNLGEHILIVTTKDSTCDQTSPIVFKSHKVILLKVLPTIDLGPDKPFCLKGGNPVELFVRGGDSYKLYWTGADGGKPQGLSADTGQIVYATPNKETSYIAYTNDLPSICKNRDTITLKVDQLNSVDVFPQNPIILCRPDYLQLEGKVFGPKPVNPISCGTTQVSTSKDVVQVAIVGSLGPGYDTLGPLTSTLITNTYSVKNQYLIRRADLLESGILYGTISALSFNVNSVDPAYEYKNFKISIKCTDEKSMSKTSFQTGLKQEYTAAAQTLVNGLNSFKFAEPYSWDTSKNLLIEICYSGNTGTATQDPVISFVPTDYLSTTWLATKPNILNSVCATNSSSEIKTNYARPEFTFDYSENVRDDYKFEYIWYPSVFLSDSTIQQPLAYIPQSTKYYMESRGRSGCYVSDSADVYIPVHNYSVVPADTAICFNEGSPMQAKGGGFTYKWYKINDKGEYEILSNTKEASCWDCANPVLKPLKTTIYKIAVYDSVWCIDTISAKVTVKPLPDIKIITRDTFVKYGQSLQLMASGARIYNWTPVGSLNNANTSFPVATPTEPTTYIAGGIGANGCRAFDTVKVDIDYRDNLFVPTGFSPNNDGKNDLFKVSNLTFQRVIEFRVFNRWGQEVFMANDNRGWDGAWKGEPQDMDTYTYTIKVGFPDGYIETYRGNTTLIR
ncbi:gliding motility-associated C-terminal domain-containing protein [Polluticoccus soli]|uniref:gliding motility-associated C-terminal domain-containing protein n=1 Tax=Polluticoccus soli TaxID=3034150 RepID=UPI0023E0D76A|nr:gliding motility-associated C-terminal domain-containing protein [Flavipsychrobacter sp. JY13-12]